MEEHLKRQKVEPYNCLLPSYLLPGELVFISFLSSRHSSLNGQTYNLYSIYSPLLAKE